MLFVYVCVSLIVLVAIPFVLDFFSRPSRLKLKGKHVLITGGSSGIGLAAAKILARRGVGTITLVARTESKLKEAKREIDGLLVSGEQHCHVLASDVSKPEKLISDIQSHMESTRAVDILIHCAGASQPAYFEDLDMDAFEWLSRVNYLGSVAAVKAVLPRMKDQGSGAIVFVTSACALLGVHGFTAYGGSKFAVRGFAECLRYETEQHGIYVTVTFPPDVDTPMLQHEMKNKPIECKLISESGGVATAQQAAQSMIDDMQARRFRSSSVNFDNHLLGIITAGFTPASSLPSLLLEGLVAGPLRVVTAFYLYQWKRIIMKCHKEKLKKEGKKHD